MDRRTFLGTATVAVIAEGLHPAISFAVTEPGPIKPMALGLLISPYSAPEETIRRVHEMGFTNCFLSLDGYINKFSPAAAKQIGDLLAKYEVTATTVEVVGPPPLEWNFTHGPSTIGLVEPVAVSSVVLPTVSPCVWPISFSLFSSVSVPLVPL